MKGFCFYVLVRSVAILAICSSIESGLRAVPLSTGFDYPVGDVNGGGWNNTAGYEWLQWTGSVYHPAEDWNMNGTSCDGDMGQPVYAISEGTIIAAGNYGSGWGNIIVIEHRLPDGSTVWSQYAHLQSMTRTGGDVGRRELIGTVGDAYGQYCAHLHFEIRTQYRSPSAWVSGWSQATILQYYAQPSAFINARRNLCTPVSIWWALLPANDRWYRSNERLIYAWSGTSPNIDEGPHAGNLAELYLAEAGCGYHRYWARAWNCGADVTIEWYGYFDDCAPRASRTGGAAPNTWYNTPQTVSWTASDDHSGVKRVWYQWNGGGWIESGGPASLPEGKNTLEVRVEDNAWNGGSHDGNVATPNLGQYWLDTVDPTITNVEEPPIETWFTDPQTITWTATDATSGVGSNTLTWDNGVVSNTTQEGNHSGTILTRDNAGNESTKSVGPYWQDSTPPVPSLSLAPENPDGQNGWYVTAPVVTVNAVDPNAPDHSGLSASYYTLDGGREQTYTIPFSILGDGSHIVSARASDVAGNSGQSPESAVKVDTTPPVMSITTPAGDWHSLRTLTASWEGADPTSGVAEYEYEIGITVTGHEIAGPTSTGLRNWLYLTNLNLVPGQTRYLKVRGRNAAGSWSAWQIRAFTPTDNTAELPPNFVSGGVSDTSSPRVSPNYRIVDSIGQFTVDTSASANYIVESGYWHSETTIPMVSAMYAWGNNGSGQLGNGTTTNNPVPKPVIDLTGIVRYSAGRAHSLALAGDRHLYVWGYNNNGQLGIGSLANKPTPVELVSLANIAYMDGGDSHSIACTTDGKVYTWGGNTSGQLGLGNTTQYTSPQMVQTLSGIVQVSTGYGHSLALANDGTIWAWGLNSMGQLGNGSQTDSLTPLHLNSVIGVIAISAGNNHSMALKGDGTVWVWGSNYSGQLGAGSGTLSTVPIQVTALPGSVSQVSAGRNFSLALTSDGNAWSWGVNDYGQLGLGDAVKRTQPTMVAVISPARSVSAGGFHSVFVRQDGTVWSSGYNSSGQLGDGTTTQRLTPVLAVGLSGVTSAFAGESFTLAMRTSMAPYETSDIAECLRIVAGLVNAASIDYRRYKVDSYNSSITLSDAALIARKVAGLEVNP